MKRLALLSLTLLASSAGQIQKFTSAQDLFREAASYVHEISSDTELDHAASELAEAQALAGFIPGAIATTAFCKRNREVVLVNIARIEARRGRYDSAISVVTGYDHHIRDRVRLEIGIEQARRGDINEAQQTAALMLDGYDRESVLYFTALELLRQGETERAKAIASTFKYPDHSLTDMLPAAQKLDWRVSAPPPPVLQGGKQTPNFYSRAVAELRAGKLEDAISAIEADPNPADVSGNFARLARDAADLGNLDAALKLATKVRVTGAEYEDGYLMGSLRAIGKLWGTEDPEAATRWARSRRSPSQRVLALSGVAEGIASIEGTGRYNG